MNFVNIKLYRCELCNTIMLERNKAQHNQTNKHEYFSNLIKNRYVIKDVEVIEFEDVFNPFFIEHTKNSIFPPYVFP